MRHLKMIGFGSGLDGVWAVMVSAVLIGVPAFGVAADHHEGDSGHSISIVQVDGGLSVFADGEFFTTYRYGDQTKPILYPIIGPGGVGMTRNYPMKPGVKGEAKDHPHHASLWFTHGNVNGISFWHNGDKTGRIVHDRLLRVEYGEGTGVIKTRNHWLGSDGKRVCTDERTLRFSAGAGVRIVDYQVTIHATDGDIKFGDTKEGSMGIRTHPNLRLKNNEGQGVTTANGHAVNSEGHRDGELWGKRAKWVDYWGDIDGKTVGVAIFDHASNPRHPTWWHARDYGLVAANPFGVHDFEKKPAGTGDMRLLAGEQVTFRYRFIFHQGDVEAAGIAGRYSAWTRE